MHHFAHDAQALRVFNIDRTHVRVGRLQTDAVGFFVEILEGGFVFVIQPDGNHFAVVG